MKTRLLAVAMTLAVGPVPAADTDPLGQFHVSNVADRWDKELTRESLADPDARIHDNRIGRHLGLQHGWDDDDDFDAFDRTDDAEG